MKKHLIAAAVAAAVAVPAAAQVTISGNLDTSWTDSEVVFNDARGGLSNTTAGSGLDEGTDFADTKGSLSSSGITFSGSEDLGGGMKANFALGYEINVGSGYTETGDTAATAMTVSRVGLSGHWGAVEFGRQTTGIHSVLTANSAIGGSNAVGDGAYSAGDVAGLSVNNWQYRLHDYGVGGAVIDGGQDGVRANNMLTYRSPTFGGGFSARLDLARDKSAEQSLVAASGSELSTNGVSVSYVSGRLSVAAGTHRISERDATQTTDDKGRTNAVSAKYDLGPVVIHGLWGSKKVDDDGVRALNQDFMQIGLTYPVGAWSFRGQYGEGTVNGATDAEEIDTKALQLVAQYSLSKRTSIYGIYGTDEAEQAASATAALIGDSVERTQIAIGLRHSF